MSRLAITTELMYVHITFPWEEGPAPTEPLAVDETFVLTGKKWYSWTQILSPRVGLAWLSPVWDDCWRAA
jgi:hypothetical protein